MPKAITDIEAATGGQLSAINNWVAGRVELRTEYVLGQGKQRRYYLDNVLELAFVVALTRAGVKATSAVAHSAQLRTLAKADKLPRFFGFADADPSLAKLDDAGSIEQWEHWFPDAAAISIVPVRKIKERVDAYFASHSVEA